MKEANNFRIIYATRYGWYILWTIFWVVLSAFILVGAFKTGNFKLELNLNSLFIISIFSVLCIYSINLILTCLLLISKNIYIKYSTKQIEFKGLYGYKCLKLEEIKSINKSNNKNLLGYMSIKRNSNWINVGHGNMMFPMGWFVEKDIRRMIDFIKNHNNQVKIDVIY